MGLLEKLATKGSNKATVLSKAEFLNTKPIPKTQVPMLNVAFSGNFDETFGPGIHMVAGPSKHFKSNTCMVFVSHYMSVYEDAICLFYDSEFGTTRGYWESVDIDMDRVLHIPVMDIEELKFDLMQKLQEIKRGDKVIVFVDSIGNLASKKEIEDALKESSAADMTRAKQLKSFFRMITPHFTSKNIAMFAIMHTYQTLELYPKQVMSGGCLVEGTKILLSDGTPVEIQNVKVGDEVMTLLGPKPVKHTWNPKTLAEGTPQVIKVEFGDWYVVECSETHPFLVKEGDEEFWVRAFDLKAGMEVVLIAEANVLQVKSLTPVGKKEVYDISVEEAEHYVLENGVVTHNTGGMLSSNSVFIMGRRQEKEGDDIVGYTFVLTVEKSRKVKEKSQIELTVTFDGGINKFSGLLDNALESGHVVSPKKGWYSRVNLETGEIEEKKWRKKGTNCDEFWSQILDQQSFKDFIVEKYTVSHNKLLSDMDSMTDGDDEDLEE